MNISLRIIAKEVATGNTLNYYKQEYQQILNHSEENYKLWVKRLETNCSKYEQYGFSETEATINGMADSLEEMIVEHYRISTKARQN